MITIRVLIIVFILLINFDAFSGEYPSDFEVCSKTLEYPEKDTGNELSELLKNREYEKLIMSAKYMLAKDSNNQEAFSLMAEATYRVAEIESGNKDIGSLPTIFIDDAGAGDPIGYKLWQIHLKIGPNYWTEDAIVKYASFLNCSIDKYINYRPEFGGFISRKMAIAISCNKLEQVIKIMDQNPKIKGYEKPSKFYARFTERFIGVNDEISAANFLKIVESKFGLDNKTKNYWESVMMRNVDERTNIKSSERKALKYKIKKIMKFE